MRYYVIEGVPNGTYNASTKARLDAEKILEKNKFKKFYVETKNGIEKNKLMKWKQLICYCNNNKIWSKSLSNLKRGDIVFIQYPLINTTVGFNNIIKKFKNNGVIFVALIHDLDSLRLEPNKHGQLLYKRVLKEDKCILNEVNYIIAHNDSMKKELIKMGNDENKIVVLELFDYLMDKEIKKVTHKVNQPLIIAGNLSSEKAQYLSQLKNIKNVNFNLYGVGLNDADIGDNIIYKGKFLPEELLDNLEGSFGLVWDGTSINECAGGYGQYLKYNNPHKTSLYLTAGIPVVVWKKSALAKFVIKNNVGIAVDNLKNLNNILNKIDSKQYNSMIKNAKEISQNTTSGTYLSEALKKVLNKINQE